MSGRYVEVDVATKSQKNYNRRRRNKIKYCNEVVLDKKIEENQSIINLRRGVDDALDFAVENAVKGPPMYVVRKSQIKGGGLGVFVSGNQFYIPKNMVIPYEGVLSSVPASDKLGRKYQVQISSSCYMLGVTSYQKGLAWGNWINSNIRESIPKGDVADMVVEGCVQNMQVANSKIITRAGKAYVRTLKKLLPGEEVLCTYGKTYNWSA